MKCLFNILSLAVIITAVRSDGMIRVYSCSSVTGPNCDLYNIFLDNNDTTRFMPSSRNPNQVTKIILRSSTIPLLNSDICQTFPNLEKFEVQPVNLKSINSNAFHECAKLKEIVIYGNSLGLLHPDTFRLNPSLEVISLWNDKLTEIQPDLFHNLTRLKTLNLYGNLLTEIPMSIFDTLVSLKEFRIHHNPITDLDVNGLLYRLPNLKEVALQDTDMECDRVKEIIAVLKGASVTVSATTWTLRTRSYKVSTVDGYYCLTTEQYQKEMLLSTLPATLASIKQELQSFGSATVIDYSSRLKVLEEAFVELKRENAILKQKIQHLEDNHDIHPNNNVTEGFESKLDHQIRVMDKFLEIQESANKLLWEKVKKLEGHNEITDNDSSIEKITQSILKKLNQTATDY